MPDSPDPNEKPVVPPIPGTPGPPVNALKEWVGQHKALAHVVTGLTATGAATWALDPSARAAVTHYWGLIPAPAHAILVFLGTTGLTYWRAQKSSQ